MVDIHKSIVDKRLGFDSDGNLVLAGARIVLDYDSTAPTILQGGTPSQGGMWADVSASDPNIFRFRDRAFIGNAALMHSNRSGANTTFLPDATTGANWGPRDSQFAVMADVGNIAIMGASRALDGDAISSPPAPIGVAGFVINDTATLGRAAWAMYSDIQHQASVSASSYGLEVAAKNKAADFTDQPYQLTYGVKGIWLAAGGDNAYGGAATNPSNAAIVILKNDDYGWNRGIVFGADAITGTDGVSSTGVAISMARGHVLRWYYAGGNTGASIRSDVDTATTNAQSLVFANAALQLFNSASKRSFQARSVTNGVNFIDALQAVASSPPTLGAAGDDTDIDLLLAGKGTGVVRFGTYTAGAATDSTGYITVKDAAGNSRKLMVQA